VPLLSTRAVLAGDVEPLLKGDLVAVGVVRNEGFGGEEGLGGVRVVRNGGFGGAGGLGGVRGLDVAVSAGVIVDSVSGRAMGVGRRILIVEEEGDVGDVGDVMVVSTVSGAVICSSGGDGGTGGGLGGVGAFILSVSAFIIGGVGAFIIVGGGAFIIGGFGAFIIGGGVFRAFRARSLVGGNGDFIADG